MNDKSIQNPMDNVRSVLKFKFDISWQLLEFHFNGLEGEACLWKPYSKSLHVINKQGIW